MDKGYTRKDALRIGAGVGLLSVPALLAGCGDSASTKTGAATNTASTKPIKLVVWDDWSSDAEYPQTAAQKAVDKLFMEQFPNITIKRTGFPYDQYPIKLRAAIATKQGPDLVVANGGLQITSFARGLVPLDDLIAGTPDLAASNRWIADSAGPDGKQYVVPFAVYGNVMHYNKKLFTGAGLDPETAPTTLNELIAACKKIAASGVTPIATAWKDGAYPSTYSAAFLAQLVSQANFAEMLKLNYPFNGPEFLSSYTTLQSLIAKGCFDKAAIGKQYEEATTDFLAKKAAILVRTSPRAEWEKDLGANNLGVFAVPTLPDAADWPAPVADAGTYESWAITQWSDNRDAAWEFITFQLSEAAQKVIWEQGAWAPANSKVTPSANGPEYASYLDVLRSPGAHGIASTFPPEVAEVGTKLSVSLVNGSISAEVLVGKLEGARTKARDELIKKNILKV